MKTGSNMNYVVKHLKRFVGPVGILAALILGLMCLAPLPPERHGGPCVEVAPGVWRTEDSVTGELTKPCSVTIVCGECVPDPGSPTGCSKDCFYRSGPNTPHFKSQCPCPSILPYDLVSSGPLDTGHGQRCALTNPRWDNLNNMPKNPFWGYQVTNCGVPDNPHGIPDPYAQCPQGTTPLFTSPGGVSVPRPPDYWYAHETPCTHIPVTYDNGFWCGYHVDFGPVMYEGILSWAGYSGRNLIDDDDYEINISRDDAAMYSHSDHIEIEFDAGETVNAYSQVISWWHNFKDAVDRSDAAAGWKINGHKAIILAPADLDAEHHFSPELHPAWLFMVHDATSPTTDDWAFFVRNWGNKGGCGTDDRQLPLQDISVLLERPGSTAGHIDVGPSSGTELAGDNPDVESITQWWQPGRGLVETFHLPPPDDHGWIAGYIHVVWTMSTVAQTPPPVFVKLPPKQKVVKSPAETTFASLVAGLSADKRAAYLKDWNACRANLARPSKGPVKIRQGNAPPSPTRSPISKVAHGLTQPQRCRVLALCRAYNNKIPGNAEVCDKLMQQEKPTSIARQGSPTPTPTPPTIPMPTPIVTTTPTVTPMPSAREASDRR